MAACANDVVGPDTGEEVDTGVDTSTDTEVDTDRDTEVDTGRDTEVDTGGDTEVDTGRDTEVDTEVDTDGDTDTNGMPETPDTPDTTGIVFNPCGGSGSLTYRGVAAEPFAACGLCGDGQLFCSGTNDLTCVGASLPNDCGGCGLLAGDVGTSCGLCGDGVWACGGGSSDCVGDRPSNGCGGCAALSLEPGTECLLTTGDAGVVVCAGRELSRCESVGTNGCGGTEPLTLPAGITGVEPRPGVTYEAGCRRGVLLCEGAQLVAFELEGGNACGGCEPLLGTPGTACDACGGVWVCDGEGRAGCEGGGRNACGGCDLLPQEPGTSCTAGGTAGSTICVGSETTDCAVPGSTNACGGQGALTDSAPLGTACGICGDGAVTCDLADPLRQRTACVGGLEENACGGCAILEATVGSACGTCGTGAFACDATLLVCTGDGGAGAANVCGGCATLAASPGDACGRCGIWDCDPVVAGRLACAEPAGGCAGLPVCGDGLVEAGEGCDDGNRVTEVCAYAERSCTVCSAGCQSVAGATAYCGDGLLDPSEACDAGSANGAGACSVGCTCSPGYHLEGGACVSDTRTCTAANATAASQTWTGSAYGACTATACASTYHLESGACASDTRACTAANATAATQTWTGSGYGTCIISTCSAGFALVSNGCVNGCGNSVVGIGETCDDGNTVTEECAYGEPACSVCNASCQTAAGDTDLCSDGVLDTSEFCDDGNTNEADSCNNTCTCGTGFHAQSGVCANDVQACTINNGVGTEAWTGSAYGACTATACDTGYHLEIGACESDTRSCTAANATAAIQTWTGSAYGACTATACVPSYLVQSGICGCDATICGAGPAPFCRGNSRVETSRTAYDLGTACECRDAETEVACPGGTNCDAGACVAIPVTQDPWILFVRMPGTSCLAQQASQLYVIRANGTDERRVTNIPGQKLAARWSPDGRSVYFSMKVTDCAAPANTNVGIYKLTVESGAIEQLTPVCPELAYQGNPDPTGLLSGGFTVLPDESALVFTNFYSGDFGLFTQPLDASGAACTVLVDDSSNSEAEPFIAACDPTTIIYTKLASGGSVTLFSTGIDGSSNSTASLTGYLGAPAINPAGTSALWTKDLGGGTTQLYSNVFNCSTHRTSGTATPVSGSTNDSSPAFFPNGNLVATERVFASATVVQTEIMVLNRTTNLTTRLTTNELLDGGPRPGLIEATTLNPAIAP